jgi:hypothetical protein
MEIKMKRILYNLEKNYSTLKSGWSQLKKTRYVPNKEESIVLQDEELEFEYTKQNNKIIKQLLDRRIESNAEELDYPKSETDEKAFDHFIKQDQNGRIVREELAKSLQHTSTNLSKTLKTLHKVNYGSFSTLIYKEKEFQKKLDIPPDIQVSTSMGNKIVDGLSLHKDKLQINSFKDEGLLLSRIQKVTFDNITTPVLRIGDKALLTDKELSMQYDLYCIEQDVYKQIILNASKLKNAVEAATHFTGMVKTNNQGEALFEVSKEEEVRPKTVYRPNKGKFVSMESHEGNTASLEYIVYKTQKNKSLEEGYELIFIPKNHKSIKQIVNICEALLMIKDTSTADPEVLDLILKKYGVSNKEVVVELINEIDKNDVSNGIFHVSAKEFASKHPELSKFIMTESENFLDKNSSYKLQVLEQKDIHNEPIIEILDEPYEDYYRFEVKAVGTSSELHLDSDSD